MKTKYFKSIIAIVLSLSMVFTLSLPAFASEGINVIETASERIAVSEENGKINEAIFDKINFVLTVNIYSKSDNSLIESTQTDLSSIYSIGEDVLRNQYDNYGITPFASVISSENTFCNFEYTRYSDNTWELRRPQANTLNWYYKNVTQNDNNKDNLLLYKASVEKINVLEFTVIGSAFTTGLLAGLSLIFGPGGVIVGAVTETALAALGFGAGATASFIALVEEMEDAYELYMLIW